MNELNINFTNLDEVVKACKKYGSSKMPFNGKNTDDENVIIEIYPNKIRVTTFQKNRWERENIYYTDGTCEELYKGKIDKP